LRVESHENFLVIEITLTIMQADVCGTSSKSLFSTEPTESIHAVIEVYVDHRFAKLDRTSDESAAVE
jgi:hypothetical protein